MVKWEWHAAKPLMKANSYDISCNPLLFTKTEAMFSLPQQIAKTLDRGKKQILELKFMRSPILNG